jgi:co-chaperonin GroES (HSP10)
MALKPVGRNLIVKFKKEKEEGKTVGALIIPINKNAPDEPVDATVLAIGDQCEFPISVNGIVLISPYSGISIRGGTEDEPHRLIVEKDILAIVTEG